MTVGFVGIGHGRKDDGTFDPGAGDADVTEHQLNTLVAHVVTAALRRSGLIVASEVDLPYRSDPNYRGSVREIARRHCTWGAEIHHDWRGGDPGIAVLYGGPKERALGYGIVELARAFNGAAKLVHAPQHTFIAAPSVPTIIVEAGRVDDAAPWAELIFRGEIIAAGLVVGLQQIQLTRATYQAA